MVGMRLIIRSSAIHAAGCYTMAPIRKGARVVEYTGPRISKDEADEKYENSPTTYLFGVGDGKTVIDGHGTAMFINHSCEPNSVILGRTRIVALSTIEPGDEVTFDYSTNVGWDGFMMQCRCGAPRCRRVIRSYTFLSPELKGRYGACVSRFLLEKRG